MEIWSKQTSDCAKSVGWEDWDRIVPNYVGHLPEKNSSNLIGSSLTTVNLVSVSFSFETKKKYSRNLGDVKVEEISFEFFDG